MGKIKKAVNLKARLKKVIVFMLVGFLALVSGSIAFFTLGTSPKVEVEEIKWGVNFSQKHAQLLNLDWKEAYLALLDDLKVKRIKLISHWDLIEKEPNHYDFEDLDWQVRQAKEKRASLLLVIGMKTPRWPECHIPEWAEKLSKKEQQEKVLKLLEKEVLRYRDFDNIWAWQVENETFVPFGECPWAEEGFLKKEIQLVGSLDLQKRPIVISDSGEGSFWWKAAQLGDVVGTTLYRKVWVKQIGRYVHYPFPPVFYWRKALVVEKLFGKRVIGVELQTEPWGPELLYDLGLEEQKKTMDEVQFEKMIEFATKTGISEFYLWGAEWMFWLKEKQGQPEIWERAKTLFQLDRTIRNIDREQNFFYNYN